MELTAPQIVAVFVTGVFFGVLFDNRATAGSAITCGVFTAVLCAVLWFL